MSTLSNYVACEALQRRLAEVFPGQDNMKAYSRFSIIRFLLSEANTNRVLRQTIAPDGKLRTVRVVYSQRRLPDETEANALVECETGVVNGETSKDYTIDPAVGRKKSDLIDPELLRLRCESDETYFARQVLELMDVVLAATERDFANYIALNLGYFASDTIAGDPAGTTTEKTVYSQSATGVILTDAYEEITTDAIANQSAVPVVFGSLTWQKYAKKIDAACCNEQGIDAGLYAANNNYLFAYSVEAAEALGDPKAAFTLVPGAVQMIYANEFANPILQVDDDALKMGTLMHPVFNDLIFDYKLKLEDCGKKWTVTVALNADLAFLPDDIYKTNDRLFGVNGINKYILETCYEPCTP